MMHALKTALFGLVLLAYVRISVGNDLTDDEFNSLHHLILPGEDDSQWMRVSWMPATDIWAARRKAANDGKPILLWYMAGEPLGSC